MTAFDMEYNMVVWTSVCVRDCMPFQCIWAYAYGNENETEWIQLGFFVRRYFYCRQFYCFSLIHRYSLVYGLGFFPLYPSLSFSFKFVQYIIYVCARDSRIRAYVCSFARSFLWHSNDTLTLLPFAKQLKAHIQIRS